MTDQKMQQAFDYFKSGDYQHAKNILIEVVKSDPVNDDAWYGLALCVDEPERKEYCLRKALERYCSIDLLIELVQQYFLEFCLIF